MQSLLMLSLLVTVTAQSGSSSCPCLSSYPTSSVAGYRDLSTNSLRIVLGGSTHMYPETYGLATCGAHDNNLAPYCHDLDVASRPAWCADNWCYVDPDNCILPTSETSYFPGAGLHYSYPTCGATNTFDDWFGDTASGNASEGRSLTDIIGVVTNYLRSMVNTLEDTHAELVGSTATCEAQESCPCVGCTINPIWSKTSPPPSDNSITFAHTTLTARQAADQTSEAGRVDRCLSRAVDTAFMRIASKEADVERVGYEYYGSQALGNYMQWPGIDWCPADYDPRYRNWYTGGVSGPKDVVIVIDTSGSMSGRREQLARDAATRVIGTLTESDFATVVTFDGDARSYSGALVRATSEARSQMQSWVASNVGADGGTDYRKAFEKTWELLRASTETSGCNRLVLFLSDGEPNEWDDNDFANVRSEAAALGNTHVMTYALGNGADTSRLKTLSCENGGVFNAVPDDGNLGDTMASYYQLLSALLRPCNVRWTEYRDWFTDLPLLSACLAAYEKDSAASSTSCEGGLDGLGDDDSGAVPKLIGVACMDLSLIVSQATIQAHPQWPTFWSEVQSQMSACPRTQLRFAQLQALRAAVSPQSVCEEPPSPSPPPPPPPSPSPSPGPSPPPAPPSPPSPPAPPASPPDLTGMIVGASIGGAVALALAVGVSIVLCKKLLKACRRCQERRAAQRATRASARASRVAAAAASSAATAKGKQPIESGQTSVRIDVSEMTLAEKALELKRELGLPESGNMPEVALLAAGVLGVDESKVQGLSLAEQITMLHRRAFGESPRSPNGVPVVVGKVAVGQPVV